MLERMLNRLQLARLLLFPSLLLDPSLAGGFTIYREGKSLYGDAFTMSAVTPELQQVRRPIGGYKRERRDQIEAVQQWHGHRHRYAVPMHRLERQFVANFPDWHAL